MSAEAGALLASGLAAGLVAGSASCTAVQGGLLAGLGDRSRTAIAWFLAGRLAAYTALGALLGLLGEVVTLPPGVRAVLLVAAGVLVAGFGVGLLRRPRGGCPATPPTPASAARGHAVAPRGSRRLREGRPALLGAATVLVPCGVTLGMEMVAVTSRSPLGGAAVMAGFVLGTSPAFALLGYAIRRVSRARTARLAGVIALAAGVWTAGTGLNLGGWLSPSISPAAAVTERAVTRPGAEQDIQSVTIWATRDGYRPRFVPARAGEPVNVEFKLVDQGCTRTVTIAGRDVALPATVRLPPQPRGTLRYVCGMGMYTGFINFS